MQYNKILFDCNGRVTNVVYLDRQGARDTLVTAGYPMTYLEDMELDPHRLITVTIKSGVELQVGKEK